MNIKPHSTADILKEKRDALRAMKRAAKRRASGSLFSFADVDLTKAIKAATEEITQLKRILKT